MLASYISSNKIERKKISMKRENLGKYLRSIKHDDKDSSYLAGIVIASIFTVLLVTIALLNIIDVIDISWRIYQLITFGTLEIGVIVAFKVKTKTYAEKNKIKLEQKKIRKE